MMDKADIFVLADIFFNSAMWDEWTEEKVQDIMDDLKDALFEDSPAPKDGPCIHVMARVLDMLRDEAPEAIGQAVDRLDRLAARVFEKEAE